MVPTAAILIEKFSGKSHFPENFIGWGWSLKKSFLN